MARLGGIWLEIRAKKDKLKNDFDGAKSETSKFGRASQATADKVSGYYKAVGLAIGALGIGAAIVKLRAFGQEAVELAGVQEGAEKRLASVIEATGNAAGITAEEMFEMAAGLQEITTEGDEVIIAGQAILATFKNVRGEGFERATAAALDMSEVMGQDLNSSIVQIGKALNDPITGMTALSRVGVTFTEDQKATVKVLQESGDLMAAQGVILAELEGQFGGAAAAARDTFAGGVKAAGNAFGDLQEEIGFTITKNEAFIVLVKAVEKQFVKWSTEIKSNQDAFKELAKKGLGAVVDGIVFAIKTMKFFHNAWLGIKLVGQITFASLAKGLEIQFKMLRVLLKPLDLIFKGLEKIGLKNPFDSLELSLETFSGSSESVAEDTLKQIEDTNIAYDSVIGSIEDMGQAVVDAGNEHEEVAKKIVKNSEKTDTAIITTKGSVLSLKDEMKFALMEAEKLSSYDEGWAEFGKNAAAAEVDVDNFFDNFKTGWDNTLKDQATWATTAEELGKTASTGIHDAISSNLFDVLTGDFDDLGAAWEGLMSNMLSSFTDNIADMALEGGKLGNAIALAGATGTVFNAFQQGGEEGGFSLLGAGAGFAVGGPLGALAGAQIGNILAGLGSSREGKAHIKVKDITGTIGQEGFGIPDLLGSEDVLGAGGPVNKFIDAFESVEDISIKIGENLSEKILTVPKEFRKQFELIISGQTFETSLDLNEQSLASDVETFATVISSEVNSIFVNSFSILAEQLGFASTEAFTEYLEMMERIATASGQTIGNAFRAGLETGDFADFGDSIRQQVYDSVFEGMITALTQSEAYRQALQPVFAGIEDAFTKSMVSGDFNLANFQSAIGPVIAGIAPAIEALSPMFTAVDSAITSINDAIGLQRFDDIDLTLSDGSNGTAPEDTWTYIRNLEDAIRIMSENPVVVNASITNAIDGESLSSTIENLVVEREENGFTNGERAASL